MHVADATLRAREIVRAVAPPSLDRVEAELGRELGREAVVFASARGAIAAAVACLGDEDLELPGYTCVAVPNAAISAKRTFRFVDVGDRGLVDADAWNAQVVVTQDTWGFEAQIPSGRIVIHDASHRADRIEAPGVTVAVTSFEDSKSLSAGQGGLALTADRPLAEQMRAWRDHHDPKRARFHLLVTALLTGGMRLRYRGRLPRLQSSLLWIAAVLAPQRVSGQSEAERRAAGVEEALLGRPPRDVPALIASQMRRRRDVAARRREVVAIYDRAAGVAREPLPFVRYPMVTQSREAFVLAFAEQDWVVDSAWFDAPLYPATADLRAYGYERGDLPRAEKLAKRIVNLPTHALVSDDEARELIAIALETGAEPLM